MNDLERRAIRAISEKYPITISELAGDLRISMKRAELLVKRLEMRGLVIRDTLPDKNYLRLA